MTAEQTFYVTEEPPQARLSDNEPPTSHRNRTADGMMSVLAPRKLKPLLMIEVSPRQAGPMVAALRKERQA
eukprot:CAMPEP_0172757266 /NCGR_PEP_ID=MMETSP1074-20121228/163445_1 /TAXON_ID=2916 /ORGANISM="Ceratium fusus, Strain PA161109" /LENGTH=70 /DNA_ID=CAMNT_0013590663 /DNA_START=42 /DNA_END=251 /DNA_ORIENTATION=+